MTITLRNAMVNYPRDTDTTEMLKFVNPDRKGQIDYLGDIPVAEYGSFYEDTYQYLGFEPTACILAIEDFFEDFELDVRFAIEYLRERANRRFGHPAPPFSIAQWAQIKGMAFDENS